jgi:hypothetical protein
VPTFVDHTARTETVREGVRAAIRSGVSYAELARATGLSDEAIRKIAATGSTRGARAETLTLIERGLATVGNAHHRSSGQRTPPAGAAEGGAVLHGRLLAVLDFLAAASDNVRVVVDSGALLAGNATAPAEEARAERERRADRDAATAAAAVVAAERPAASGGATGSPSRGFGVRAPQLM